MESPPTEWWKTYFDGVTNDVFRHIMGPQASADAAKIEKILALPPRSRVLDVPCGHGRIAVELAARGHVVTGLDRASSEIARAKATARERGVEVELALGDMRTDVPSRAYDAAVCFGHSFGYFTDDDNLSFLRGVYASLRPGGAFALETCFCLESYLPLFAERARPHWKNAGETYLLQTETLDVERGRLHLAQTYVTPASGRVEDRRLSCRMYTYREIVVLMQSCGFEGIRGLDAAGDEPFRIGSPLVLVARRPA